MEEWKRSTFPRSGVFPEGGRFRMVALDLDGTLLSDDHQIAKEQIEYLRSLHMRGFVVCFATGRAAPSVYEHVRKLNLPVPIPVVCSNGACGFEMDAASSLHHHHHNEQVQPKELFCHPVSIDTVNATLFLARKNGFGVQYYHKDLILVNSNAKEHATIVQQYSKLTGSTVTYVSDDFQSLLSQGNLPSKLLVLFPEYQKGHATQVYSTQLSSDLATIVPGVFDWYLEVLSPQVNKGYGLTELCRYLDIPLSQCIAIGDGSNDLEFLQLAGLGIAMKNAKESVKKHADLTIEWTNVEHGVMKVLQHLEQEGRLALTNCSSSAAC